MIVQRLAVLSMVLASVASAAGPAPEKKPEFRLFGYAGSLQVGEGGAGLKDGGAGAVLGVGLDQRFGPNLIGSLDATIASMDYGVTVDLGPFANDEVDVDTAWVGYLVKGVLPAGRVELFIGAGLGLGFSEASVRSDLLLFFSGTVAEENDWALGSQALAGLDFRLGAGSRLGLEYRRLKLEADFGELSGGKVDVGGDVFVVVYRARVSP